MLAQAESGFRGRVIRAASWTAAAHVFTQALRFGGNLLMTRLLAPEAFGQMAVVTTLLIGCAMLSDLGLRQNIVQSPRGSDRAFLATAWSVQILRGLLLFLVFQALALAMRAAAAQGLFPDGSVYRDPLLPQLIHVMGFVYVVGAFDSTKLARAQRDMALGRTILLEVASHAVGLLATILWGLAYRDAWALLVGALVSALLHVVLGHLIVPGPADRIGWERGAWREIIGFGKWVFLSSLLGFFAGSGDRLLLGVLFDSHTLGLTAIAMLILGAFQEGFGKLVVGVAFPAMSETVRQRPRQLKAVYYKFRSLADAAFMFCAGLFFLGGNALVDLLYDMRYDEAGAIFSILSLSLVAASFGVAHQAWLALGRPDLLSWTTATRLVSMFAFVIPAGAAWGIRGAAWALVAAHVPAVVLTLRLNAKLGLLDVRSELRGLPFLAAGVAAGGALDWLLRLAH